MLPVFDAMIAAGLLSGTVYGLAASDPWPASRAVNVGAGLAMTAVFIASAGVGFDRVSECLDTESQAAPTRAPAQRSTKEEEAAEDAAAQERARQMAAEEAKAAGAAARGAAPTTSGAPAPTAPAPAK